MKILVPVDGSKSALNAVKYAAKLSANMRSTDTVTLITVHDDQGLRHAKQLVGKAEVDDYLRELSDKELKTSLAVLKKAGNKNFTIHKFEGLNHLFQKCTKCTVAEYGQLENTIEPEVLDTIGDWLARNSLK